MPCAAMRTTAVRRLLRSSIPRSNPTHAKLRRDARSLPARPRPSRPKRYSVRRSLRSSVPGTAPWTNFSRTLAPTSAWRLMPRMFTSLPTCAGLLTMVNQAASAPLLSSLLTAFLLA
ncbi:hypothetical protein IWX90DRAFT_514579 [Phyllosticta citrichinensis]|uniref:Uncharacterized protein n=1 Tax=Phyllosticta citrichinensis TaxID=1130410 RepID=A0ABR1XQN1_9PEZI